MLIRAFSDFTLDSYNRCLSVDKLLAIFCLMLQEEKIVFICNSNALLTETMETLRSLLFPLTWSSCFVSRLPDSLSGHYDTNDDLHHLHLFTLINKISSSLSSSL